MAKQRHLSKAPITEAIIDFRVKLPHGFRVESFATLKEELKRDYPKVTEKRFREFQIKNGKVVEEKTKEGLEGYFFKTEDEKNVVQFRINGFTFSRLKPYTRWEDIFKEARRLWLIYAGKSSPEVITKIAVRYINHFTIPYAIHEFSEYLEAPPIVPEGLPQILSSFLTRVVMNDRDNDLDAKFTQALDPRGNSSSPTFIIDIDVFKNKEFEISAEQIWHRFEQLRMMKNKIFFKSITEKTAKLFE